MPELQQLKIKSVMFFPNGNTAVFDENGDQMPGLQESWIRLWAKHAEGLGYDVCLINNIILPNQDYASFFRIEDGDVNWKISEY